jgi:hypothetical protein
MPNVEIKKIPPEVSKDFSAFEKEALETSSNDALKLDLQRHLNKLHREQREDIEERISAIEKRCNEEIRKTLEKHVQIQIEKHFYETLESLQEKVFELFSPLVKQAEADVSQLQVAVYQTNHVCNDIQKKYAFRWGKPFALLIISTALTGAFMGLMLYLMQVGPLAVFLMNEEIRRTYDKGQYRLDLEALARRVTSTKSPQNSKKMGKPSQG